MDAGAFDATEYLRQQRLRSERMFGRVSAYEAERQLEQERKQREAEAAQGQRKLDEARERERLLVEALQARIKEGRDRALAYLTGTQPKRAKEIIKAVADKHGLELAEMMSKRRAFRIVYARQEAMWILSKETTLSYPSIGALFDMDHTTIMHGVDAHARRIGEQVYHSRRIRIDDPEPVVTIREPRPLRWKPEEMARAKR